MILVESLMEKFELTHEELVSHWEAHDYLSRHGSEVKLKKIPSWVREKIAALYAECRSKGIYPMRPQEGKMEFLDLVSYEEGWKRSRKLRAPESLAEMEPR
jgi:hypothetical protein